MPQPNKYLEQKFLPPYVSHEPRHVSSKMSNAVKRLLKTLKPQKQANFVVHKVPTPVHPKQVRKIEWAE